MRRLNLLVCGALLGAGVLLSGCGAGADTTTPAPPANSATLSATSAPVIATTAAYPPPRAAETGSAAAAPSPTTAAAPPTATKAAYPPPPTPDQNQSITDANNGQTIRLKVGQTLLVVLHDRKWSAPKVDSKILAVDTLNIAVLQGATAWKYKAITPGQTTFTTDGACLPNPSGGASCQSILAYKVTIIVTS